MRASIKSKYEGGAAGEAATATLSFGVGDLKLRASCTDATFSPSAGGSGGLSIPSLAGVSLGVEKPGWFIIEHEIQSRSTRFQFMNAARIGGKQVKLTYIHPQRRNATVLEGTLTIDARNKITGKYTFASGKAQLKYTYEHLATGLTLEPWYDFGTESWNFAASRELARYQSVKAVYETRHKLLGVEWINDDPKFGPFKVAAALNVENSKPPKLLLEKTWSYDF